MRMHVKLVLLFTLTGSFQSYAMKYYGALPEQSNWKVVKATPIECRIEHDIPSFGSAHFSSRAGKKINLSFILDMALPMGKTENVSLVSMPAPWRSGEAASYLDMLRFYKQFDGYADAQVAWNILSELEQGNLPTFHYQEWQSKSKEISVYLSPVAFQKTYEQFRNCISKLLPYSFEDIAFTTLQYSEDGELLDDDARKKLAQINEYLRYSQDIELLLISAYTDSRGSQKDNLNTTQTRAEALQEHFISLGLARKRIQIKAFGETKPIAVNDTVKGRNQNRRVVISFVRD